MIIVMITVLTCAAEPEDGGHRPKHIMSITDIDHWLCLTVCQHWHSPRLNWQARIQFVLSTLA